MDVESSSLAHTRMTPWSMHAVEGDAPVATGLGADPGITVPVAPEPADTLPLPSQSASAATPTPVEAPTFNVTPATPQGSQTLAVPTPNPVPHEEAPLPPPCPVAHGRSQTPVAAIGGGTSNHPSPISEQDTDLIQCSCHFMFCQAEWFFFLIFLIFFFNFAAVWVTTSHPMSHIIYNVEVPL